MVGQNIDLCIKPADILLPGVATAPWKAIQYMGRLGRDAADQAVFVTVCETKKVVRGNN